MTDDFMTFFETQRYDTEHALSMYANGFVTIPAKAIYDDALLEPYADIIRKCHVYLIGLAPRLSLDAVDQDGDGLRVTFTIGASRVTLDCPLPPGAKLFDHPAGGWAIRLSDGTVVVPDQDELTAGAVSKAGGLVFKILYIGQAFGEDGSRHALDRLRKHETLQKIALKGVPADSELSLILIEMEPSPRMITAFNPRAKEKDDEFRRIDQGLDVLCGTDEAERTTLYEASLIRYFQPQYNKIFRDSFPSTNNKILARCYDKDIASIVAEISIDALPYRLASDVIPARHEHIARHNLHKEEDRQFFFSRKLDPEGDA